MKLNEYLKESGVLNLTTSKDQNQRIREFCRVLHQDIKTSNEIRSQNEDHLFILIGRMARFVISLMKLDQRPMDQIPYEAIRGMALALGWALKNNQDIRFVSFASPAIDVSSRQVRDKEQYRMPATVFSSLQEITQELPAWRYEVLLADYDFRLMGHEFTHAWEENLKLLSTRSAMPVSRLSTVFPESELEKVKDEILATRGLEIEKEVARISSSQELLLSFGTTPERNTYQAFLYAACGVWLEQNFPTCIVMDIQKKIYPCEQPFFQKARNSPLALIRVPY